MTQKRKLINKLVGMDVMTLSPLQRMTALHLTEHLRKSGKLNSRNQKGKYSNEQEESLSGGA